MLYTLWTGRRTLNHVRHLQEKKKEGHRVHPPRSQLFHLLTNINTHSDDFYAAKIALLSSKVFKAVRMHSVVPFSNSIAAQVADMQVLIKAAPVPAFVADRLVRKIVNKWIFQSTEKPTNDTSATSRSGYHGRRGRSVDRSTDSVPTLRRRDSPLRSTHR